MDNRIQSQWIGALLCEDMPLLDAMLDTHPALVDMAHEALDDPYRLRRLPVATLLFAVVGPPQQMIRWHQSRRQINPELVHLLLRHDADPNVYSIHGRPLCWVRDPMIAEQLVDAGGDINLWHDNGGSPLNFSVWQFDPERLQMHLDLGADATACNPADDESLFHTWVRTARWGWAVDESAIEACGKLLLAAGADPNHPNRDGNTPRYLAEAADDEGLVELLDRIMAG